MHAKRTTAAAAGARAARAGEGQEGVQEGADVRRRRARLPVASPRSGAVRQGDASGAGGGLHPSFKLVSDPAAILWTWKTRNPASSLPPRYRNACPTRSWSTHG